VDEAIEVQVVAMKRAGATKAQIIAATGLSGSTVARVLRRNGAATPPRGLHPGVQAALACLYRVGGETYARLAARFGLSETVVAKAVRAQAARGRGRPARRGRGAKGDARRGRGRREPSFWRGYSPPDAARAARWLSGLTPETRGEVLEGLRCQPGDVLEVDKDGRSLHTAPGVSPESTERVTCWTRPKRNRESFERGDGWGALSAGLAVHEAKARKARDGFDEAARRARVDALVRGMPGWRSVPRERWPVAARVPTPKVPGLLLLDACGSSLVRGWPPAPPWMGSTDRWARRDRPYACSARQYGERVSRLEAMAVDDVAAWFRENSMDGRN
jgi:transposase-like protein